jgi:hypothetical protein
MTAIRWPSGSPSARRSPARKLVGTSAPHSPITPAGPCAQKSSVFASGIGYSLSSPSISSRRPKPPPIRWLCTTGDPVAFKIVDRFPA